MWRFRPSWADITQAFVLYFLQRRFSIPALAGNWFLFTQALLSAAGIAALAWYAGAKLLRLFEPGKRLGPGGTLTALAAGFALLGTLVLGAGLAGLLFSPSRVVIAPLICLLGLGAIWKARKKASAFLAWVVDALGTVSLPTRLALLLGIIITAAGLFNIEMAWDALTYHLRLPSFFVYRHKIFDVWHLFYFPFPSLVEMLYLLGMLVQGDQAARFLNAFFGLMLLASVRPLARALKADGRMAALLLLASPLFLLLLIRAYIDLGFSLLLSVSFFHLVRWRLSASRGALVLSALLAGAGMGSKYVGVLALPALLAAGGVRLLRPSLRPCLLWCAFAFAPLAPWLARNWLFEANPFSPMLDSFFGVVHERFPDIVPFFESGRRLSAVLLSLPREAAQILFDEGKIDGPLAACVGGAVPLLILARGSGPYRFLLRAVLGYILAWLILCPNARFFLPALVPLVLLLETPLLSMIAETRGLRIVIEAQLVCGALFAAATQWIFFAPFSMVLGLESVRDRLAIGLPPPPFHYYTASFINEHVPPQARIMCLCNFSTYYIERECVAEFRFGRSRIARIIREGGSAMRIGVKLRQRGIRWLLSSRSGTAAYVGLPGFFDVPAGGWRAFRDLLSRRGYAVWQTEGFVLFRLGREHEPRPLPVLPVYESIVFNKGDRLLDSGDLRGALREFQSPPALMRDVASTYLRQADAHLALEEVPLAEKCFLRALELGADQYRVRAGLAQVYLRLGQPALALPHAEKAFASNPVSGYAAATLSLVCSGLSDIHRARLLMEEAVRLAPYEAQYRDLAAQLRAAETLPPRGRPRPRYGRR